MKKMILFIFLFSIGCSTFKKKESNNPIPQKKLPNYNGLCFSPELETYYYTDNVKVLKIDNNGIRVKLENENESFILKDTCVLERNNITFKKIENEGNFDFKCLFDEIADDLFFGQGYQVVKFYEDGKFIQLFNKKLNKEILIETTNCSVYLNEINK